MKSALISIALPDPPILGVTPGERSETRGLLVSRAPKRSGVSRIRFHRRIGEWAPALRFARPG